MEITIPGANWHTYSKAPRANHPSSGFHLFMETNTQAFPFHSLESLLCLVVVHEKSKNMDTTQTKSLIHEVMMCDKKLKKLLISKK